MGIRLGVKGLFDYSFIIIYEQSNTGNPCQLVIGRDMIYKNAFNPGRVQKNYFRITRSLRLLCYANLIILQKSK
jgi:hypothetical protein